MKKLISLLVLLTLLSAITACAGSVKSFDDPTKEPLKEPRSENASSAIPKTGISKYDQGAVLVPWTQATFKTDLPDLPFKSLELWYMVEIPKDSPYTIEPHNGSTIKLYKRYLHLKDAENPDGTIIFYLGTDNITGVVMAAPRNGFPKRHTVPSGTKLYTVLNLLPEQYTLEINSIHGQVMAMHPIARRLAIRLVE